MKKTRGIATMIGSIAAVAIVLATLRVWAAGIPNSNALHYSGVLENAAGELITGTHDIEVRFWDAASAGSVLCSTTADDVALQNGRFSVPLLDDCTDSVHDAPDVWVEIIVDATSLGRSKIGAVPYAVEADRAIVAESAAVADTANRLGTLTPSAVQQRVSGVCNVGSSIRTINADGTVGCEDDSVLTESQVDAFAANNGYALATDLASGLTTKQNRITGMCAAGRSIRAIASDGSVTCEDDNDTTYSAGTGLSLNGTTFSAGPLDTRINALEGVVNGVGTVLEGNASTRQDGTYTGNLVYSHITVTLTPGTWLVQGFAGLATTDNPDMVQLGLWNTTTNQEVSNARSAPASTIPGVGTAVALTTSRTLVISADTSVRLYAMRNGSSTVRVVGTADATWTTPHARIMATRVK